VSITVIIIIITELRKGSDMYYNLYHTWHMPLMMTFLRIPFSQSQRTF